MELKVPQMITSLFVSVLFSSLLLCMTSMVMVDGQSTNNSDQLALLAFKGEITQDPLGTLISWNDSVHFCEWGGVTCSRSSRVTILDLRSQSLVGSISPHIGNLSFLEELILYNNSFNGEIPQEVGRLFRLQSLRLAENLLEGQIPVNLSRCINLKDLRLSKNKLVGRIPGDLGILSELRNMSLGGNNLSGEIPPSLGNLSSLNCLDLRENNLGGSIPSALSRLTSLRILYLPTNKFTGIVPPLLYNLSSLNYLSLMLNQLEGSFPSDIGLTLPNLKEFSITQNKFSGTIPSSLSNSSGLEMLQFSQNDLVGSVPNNLGDLKGLKWLSVGENSLGSGHADDLNFLNSLINCTSLEVLFMHDNKFGGVLPNSVANLSTKLTQLLLGRNQISGSIPTGIQNLVGLTLLGLEENLFTGSIPIGIGKLLNLNRFSLLGNKLSGQIPSSFGNLTELSELSLASNNLTGRIPSTLGNCKSLQSLELQGNKLSGTIPQEVIGLSSLSIFLNFANNSLSGSLPLEVGNLKNLGVLILSENKLSGEIPSTLGECSSLRQLRMEGNLFYGKIPPSLSFIKGLEDLNLARNNLSGRIPRDLGSLTTLWTLDLSFNNLEGDVPRDGVFKNLTAIIVDGNVKLCDGVPELQLPNCPIQLLDSKKLKKTPASKVIMIIVPVLVLCLTLIAFLLTLYWRKKFKKRLHPTNSDIANAYLGVSYYELLKATNGFDFSNLLGAGSFGFVYKGILDEKHVAVKVLNLQQKGAIKGFMAECDTLRKARHRNLLKILTCCSSTDFQGNDFKALVYEYMANGNLENWLHPKSIVDDDQLQWRNLSLEERLNIAVDVASALDYLHRHCKTPIVHCDLKPSNVLLDDDLIAHVGDFGLAKFLSKPSSYSGMIDRINSTTIKGSIGYIAPENGMGGEVSRKGDVYSYGILLLEMFTGKRPTDDIFKDGLSLHTFCKLALPLQVLEIVDSSFLDGYESFDNEEVKKGRHQNITRAKLKETLASIIRIGVVCSSELQSDRIDMNEVIVDLQLVKNRFVGVGM